MASIVDPPPDGKTEPTALDRVRALPGEAGRIWRDLEARIDGEPSPAEHKTAIPPCASAGCPEPGTVYGIYDDGDERSRVNYCPECAGYLYREFTPLGSTTLDFRALVVQVLPLPGEVMTVAAYERIVDDLLLRPRGDA